MTSGNAVFPRSGVLVVGGNSIQSLLPATLISQVEALLQSHRIQEAVELAEQQQKKLQGKVPVDEDEKEELDYVYQRIGFQCFSETLFEEAGLHFMAGHLDPRVLVSYFPDLRGALFTADDTVPMFGGVAEHMPPYVSIDDITAADIARNYSPHMAPNTRDAPATAELRQILNASARQMLGVFLRKYKRDYQATRTQRKQECDPEDRPVMKVVDTVLAKLFAEDEKTTDLYALLQNGMHAIDVGEIKETFIRTGQYNALLKLFRLRAMHEELLEGCSKLVDGTWTDDDIPDPLARMVSELDNIDHSPVREKWSIWLTGLHPEEGIKMLTSKDGLNSDGKRSKADQLKLLEQLKAVNPVAGAKFLGHLVLKKKSTDRNLHTELALLCVDHLNAALSDPAVSKLWRAKAASYAKGNEKQSFLAYFAATTPESAHKRARLKAALFLQGSALYDAGAVQARLVAHAGVLRLESAIVEGKLGNHRAALAVLVHELNDGASAEAYCALGGEVVPARTARAIGEEYGLQGWAATLVPTARAGGAAAGKTVDEELRSRLLRVLVEVYMSKGEGAAERTARLLNAQGMNLDVLDVVSAIPDPWPLTLMSSFLARSFRRTLHAKHEGQIVKNISMAQNLEVSERTWDEIRMQGGLVEDEVDDDGGDEKEKEPAEYPFPDVGREKGVSGSFDGNEKVGDLVGERIRHGVVE